MNLKTLNPVNFVQPYSCSVVVNPKAASYLDYRTIYRNTIGSMNIFTENSIYKSYAGTNLNSNVAPVQNKKVSIFTEFNSNNSSISVTGVNSSGNAGTQSNSDLLIVPGTSYSNRLNCGISEIVIFNKLVDKKILEANQKAFYNLT